MSKSKTRQMAKSNKQSRFGAVTVEVAICLPVLFLLLFACLEIAGANMLKHATESAAYEGARVGILPGATPEGVQSAVDSVLVSIGAQGSSIEILPQVITQETEEIEVIVSVPYAPNAFIAPFVIRNNPTFRSSVTLRREIL